MATSRKAEIIRQTKETQIKVELSLDGNGKGSISTGIPFFDHMLDLFSRHGFFDLSIQALEILKLIIIIWLRIWVYVWDRRSKKHYQTKPGLADMVFFIFQWMKPWQLLRWT